MPAFNRYNLLVSRKWQAAFQRPFLAHGPCSADGQKEEDGELELLSTSVCASHPVFSVQTVMRQNAPIGKSHTQHAQN